LGRPDALDKVKSCTNVSRMESVLQSELSFGAVPSDVSGDATCDMKQSKLLLIMTGVLDLELMLPVHVFLLLQQ